MRTNLEFRSTAFPAYPCEDEKVNPGLYGKRLAQFLAAELPGSGYVVEGLNAEDWGWRLDLQNDLFPLWIGCANYGEFEDGFHCFIEPSKPLVRRWLKSIATSDTVERLAVALEHTLRQGGKVENLRWWTESESERG